MYPHDEGPDDRQPILAWRLASAVLVVGWIGLQDVWGWRKIRSIPFVAPLVPADPFNLREI